MDEKLAKLLKDYVATAASGKYKDWDEINSKFPELKDYDPQILKDYVATAASGKYKSWDEINGKFPEFSSATTAPVKKKEESISESSEGTGGSTSTFEKPTLSNSRLANRANESSSPAITRTGKIPGELPNIRDAGYPDAFMSRSTALKGAKPDIDAQLPLPSMATPTANNNRLAARADARPVDKIEIPQPVLDNAKATADKLLPKLDEDKKIISSTEYTSKYKELEALTLKKLQEKYPGKKVEVRESSGRRDYEKQQELLKKGYSTTSISLHNFDAARDYNLFVDGKMVTNTDLSVYQDTLWKAAEELGLYHLNAEEFGAVDPYHIGLVEELGDGTAFERLFNNYPEIKSHELTAQFVDFLKNNKQLDTTGKFDMVINSFYNTKDAKSPYTNTEFITPKFGDYSDSKQWKVDGIISSGSKAVAKQITTVREKYRPDMFGKYNLSDAYVANNTDRFFVEDISKKVASPSGEFRDVYVPDEVKTYYSNMDFSDREYLMRKPVSDREALLLEYEAVNHAYMSLFEDSKAGKDINYIALRYRAIQEYEKTLAERHKEGAEVLKSYESISGAKSAGNAFLQSALSNTASNLYANVAMHQAKMENEGFATWAGDFLIYGRDFIANTLFVDPYNATAGEVLGKIDRVDERKKITPLTGNGYDMKAYAMYQMAKYARETGQEMFPTNPDLQNSFWLSHVPQGIGSLVPTLATAAGTYGVGLAVGAGTRAITAASKLSGASMGGLQMAGMAYMDALGAGASERDAFDAGMANMVIGTAGEAVSMGIVLKRLDDVGGKSLQEFFKKGLGATMRNMARDGVREGVTEFLQEVSSNMVAQDTYDKTRKVMDNAVENGLVGFVVGSIIPLSTGIMSGASNSIDAAWAMRTVKDQLNASLSETLDLDRATDIGAAARLIDERLNGNIPVTDNMIRLTEDMIEISQAVYNEAQTRPELAKQLALELDEIQAKMDQEVELAKIKEKTLLEYEYLENKVSELDALIKDETVSPAAKEILQQRRDMAAEKLQERKEFMAKSTVATQPIRVTEAPNIAEGTEVTYRDKKGGGGRGTVEVIDVMEKRLIALSPGKKSTVVSASADPSGKVTKRVGQVEIGADKIILGEVGKAFTGKALVNFDKDGNAVSVSFVDKQGNQATVHDPAFAEEMVAKRMREQLDGDFKKSYIEFKSSVNRRIGIFKGPTSAKKINIKQNGTTVEVIPGEDGELIIPEQEEEIVEATPEQIEQDLRDEITAEITEARGKTRMTASQKAQLDAIAAVLANQKSSKRDLSKAKKQLAAIKKNKKITASQINKAYSELDKMADAWEAATGRKDFFTEFFDDINDTDIFSQEGLNALLDKVTKKSMEPAAVEVESEEHPSIAPVDTPLPANFVSNQIIENLSPLAYIFNTKQIGKMASDIWKVIKDLFSNKHGFSRETWLSLLRHENSKNAIVREIVYTTRELEKTVKQEYGKKATPESVADIDKAFKGDAQALANLQPATAQLVTKMRDQVDLLSRQFVQDGLLDEGLEVIFKDNEGKYVTRAYRVHQDPKKWRQFLEDTQEGKTIRLKAVNWILQQYQAAGTPITADAAEGIVSALYDKNNFNQFMNQGMMQGKDLSLFKKKNQDIAEPILELLGEIKDPVANYAITVYKMANFIATHKFLNEVKDIGILEGFISEEMTAEHYLPIENPFTKKPKYGNTDGLKLKPKSRLRMNPLEGYVTREFAEAMEAYNKRYELTPELRWYMKINGAVKLNKTVWSAITHVRNFRSNVSFFLANGYIGDMMIHPLTGLQLFARTGAAISADLGTTNKAFGMVSLYDVFNWASGKNKFASIEEAQAEYARYTRLGVTRDGAGFGELRDIIRDADGVMDSAIEKLLQKGVNRRFSAIKQGVQDVYGAEDDFWKILSFELEARRQKAARPSLPDADVDVIAAEIIKNTMPTYSRVAKGVKVIRRIPLIGSFTSFPAEVIRVSYNIPKQAVLEINEGRKTKNSALIVTGLNRLLGIAGAATMPMFADLLYRLWDDDDEHIDKQAIEDLRLFLTPWDKRGELINVVRDGETEYSFINSSYTEPFAMWREVVNAYSAEDAAFEGTLAALGRLYEPFLSKEMLVQRLMEIEANQKEGGGRVYNDEDDNYEQWEAISEHLAAGIEPGIMTSARRIYRGFSGYEGDWGQVYDAGDEIKNIVTGQRRVKTDVKRSYSDMVKDLDDRLANAKNLFTSVEAYRRPVTQQELDEAHDKSIRKVHEILDEFKEVTDAARRLGVSGAEAEGIWKDRRLPLYARKFYITGQKVPAWERSRRGVLQN